MDTDEINTGYLTRAAKGIDVKGGVVDEHAWTVGSARLSVKAKDKTKNKPGMKPGLCR